MALIITSSACGLFALLAALALLFQLPLWRYIAGIHRTGAERLANIDVPRLRNRLSVLFLVLSLGLLGGALLLYVKVITESLAIPLFFALAIVVFDGFALVYRTCDRNDYSEGVRRSFRFFLAVVHGAFLLLAFLFLH